MDLVWQIPVWHTLTEHFITYLLDLFLRLIGFLLWSIHLEVWRVVWSEMLFRIQLRDYLRYCQLQTAWPFFSDLYH